MFYRESAECPFTITTDQDFYPGDVEEITVVMTGVFPGRAITMNHGWYLECLSDPDVEPMAIYSTEILQTTPPKADEYATLSKTIRIQTAYGYALPPGDYRLSAATGSGEDMEVLSSCTFTISELQEPHD